MSITVKLSNGTQKTVDVPDFSITVNELKRLVALAVDIPEDEQRIVLRGKVLKDGDILSAVGMESGNAVHVVGCKKKSTPALATEIPASAPTLAETTPATAPTTQGSTAGVAQSNPYAALLGAGGMVAPQTAGNAMPGNFMNSYGGAGMGMNPTPQQAMEMMQNPFMQQFMQQAMSDPQFMQQLVQSNPMLANMPPEALQQSMQMMQNPEMMRQMMSMMGGMSSPSGSAAPASATGVTAAQPQVPGFGGMNFNPAMFAPPQTQGDPREIYREQLAQLREMGFPNEDANIAALQQSQGNLSFAIERLFSA